MNRNGDPAEVLPISRWEEDKPRQYFRLFLEEDILDEENYRLTMEFMGFLIKPDFRGFYLTDYRTDDDRGKTYVLIRTILKSPNPLGIVSTII